MSILETILYITLGVLTAIWVTVIIVKGFKKKKGKNQKEDED